MSVGARRIVVFAAGATAALVAQAVTAPGEPTRLDPPAHAIAAPGKPPRPDLPAPATAASAPPTRLDLPAGELRLSSSRVAVSTRARIRFTVKLDRAVSTGELTLTLPRLWARRSGVSAMAFARLPRKGRGSSARVKVTRADRVVTFRFTRGRKRDCGRFDVHDNGIPAGTYRLAYSWREGAGSRTRGSARVVFQARPRRR